MTSTECSICVGTKMYINAYGRISDQPCNICDPEGWDRFLRAAGIRK